MGKNISMESAKVLDIEINHYLAYLNDHQKEVVLSVVKTFANKEKECWNGADAAANEKTGAPHDRVMKKYEKWMSQ